MKALTALVAGVLAFPVDALACGGFFCNREFPIEQAGEVIVFGLDEAAQEVTVHVGITYEGASEDFAWIVPVSAAPDLFVSSDALFTALGQATKPYFYLNTESTGVCSFDPFVDYDLASASEDSGADDGGVSIVSEARVGPYETIVLQANDTAALLTFLQGAGYDLPNDLDPVLRPYVASGQYFVALKLAAGNDTGDLAPLGMRYPGTAASVPIQLTSVAATPDMRLEVYVLGDRRAVPDNYLHLTINDAAIDWFGGGANYNDVISLAADEAGGHGFATDFSGSTAPFRGTLWSEGRYDLDRLRAASGPIEWTEELLGMGFPGSSALLELFMDLIPFPAALERQGVTPQNFYDCLGCYAQYVDASGFSAVEATAQLETRVIDGLRAAEEIFTKYAHVTRMTSSLDAVEMTVDPQFVFNRDLPQTVSNVRSARVVYHCGAGEGWNHAERTLILADGRRIRLPSEAWLERNGMTEYEAMGDLTSPAAILIESYGTEGLGESVFDWREQAFDEASRFNRPGCACDAGTSPGTSVLGLLLGATLIRRRRRQV